MIDNHSIYRVLFGDRFRYSVRRSISEVHLQDESNEAHEVPRHGCDFSEVGAGRIRVGVLPVLPVEQVLDVNAWLDTTVLADCDRAAQAHVEEAQRLPANAVDAERELPFLEARWGFRGVLFETGICVKPPVARRVVYRNVSYLAIEEQIGPETRSSQFGMGW